MIVEPTYKDLNRKFGEPGVSDLLYDKEAIAQALYNIFSTTPGEAGPIFDPNFGSLLPQLIHEPMDNVTVHRLQGAIFQAVQRWEPRVEVNIGESSITPDFQTQSYYVVLSYRIRATGINAVSNLRLRANELSDFLPFSTLEKTIALHQLGWPGIREFCVVAPNGDLVLDGSSTWEEIVSWDLFLQWDGSGSGHFVYTTIVDNLTEIPRVVTSGITGPNPGTVIEVLISYSSNGVTFSSFQPLTNTPISARYMKFQVTVSGSMPRLDIGNLFFYI